MGESIGGINKRKVQWSQGCQALGWNTGSNPGHTVHYFLEFKS